MTLSPVPHKVAEPASPDVYKYYGYLLLLLLGILFCWGHHLYGLFDGHETLATQISIEMATPTNNKLPTYNNEAQWHKPPLGYWLQSLSLQVMAAMPYQAEHSAQAARLPSALLMWLATIFFFRFVRTTTHNNRLALTATAILGANALWLLPARMATPDALLQFSILSSTLLAIHVLYRRKISPGYQILIGLLLAVGILAKGASGVLIPALTIGFTVMLKPYFFESLRILNPFYILTGLLLGLLPWILLILNHGGTGFFEEFVLAQQVQNLAQSAFADDVLFYHLLILLIGFFPWSVLLLVAIPATHKKVGDDCKSLQPERALPVIGLLWLLSTFVVSGLSPTSLFFGIIPALPGAALILAVWAEGLSGARHVRYLGVLFSIIFGLCALAAHRLLIAAQPNMTDPLLTRIGITWPPPDAFTAQILSQEIPLNLAPYGISILLIVGGLAGFWALSKQCRSGLWVLVFSQLGILSLGIVGILPVAYQYWQKPLHELAQIMKKDVTQTTHVIHYQVSRPSVRLVSGQNFQQVQTQAALTEHITPQQTMILTPKHLLPEAIEALPKGRRTDAEDICQNAYCLLKIPAAATKDKPEKQPELENNLENNNAAE